MDALLKLIQTKHWAMEPGYFGRASDIVISRLKAGKDFLPDFVPGNQKEGEIPSPTKRAEFAMFEMDYDRKARTYYFKIQGKNVAYIPIKGALSKGGDMCSYGMRHYGQFIMGAENSDSIHGIILDFDTPGGTVDGTVELASIISQVSKPIVAFVDGMMASAGVWLGSQTNHIMANAASFTEVGSIGVLYMHVDARKWVEKEIGSIEIIRAPQSKDKARVNSFEELPEEERTKLLAELEEIANAFFEAVKTGRSGKLTEEALGKKGVFTGKMYSKEDALSLGLIDSVGSFTDALQLIVDLASGTQSQSQSNSKSNSKSNNNSMKIKNTWSAILAFFGFSVADAENGTAVMTEEQGEQLNTELANLQSTTAAQAAEIDQLKADNATAQATIAAHEATIAAHVATIAEQQTRLDAKPAGAATTVVTETDRGPEYQQKDDDYSTSVDAELKQMKGVMPQ